MVHYSARTYTRVCMQCITYRNKKQQKIFCSMFSKTVKHGIVSASYHAQVLKYSPQLKRKQSKYKRLASKQRQYRLPCASITIIF